MLVFDESVVVVGAMYLFAPHNLVACGFSRISSTLKRSCNEIPQMNIFMGQCTLRNLDDYNSCGIVLLNHLDLLLLCGSNIWLLVLGSHELKRLWNFELQCIVGLRTSSCNRYA